MILGFPEEFGHAPDPHTMPCQEQGLLSCTAASQLMLVENTLDCGHSAAGNSLPFLPDHGRYTTLPCTLYSQLFAQLILGPETVMKLLQVTFLT